MLTKTERGSWIALILSLPLTIAMMGAWALVVSREGMHWLIQTAVFLALLAMVFVLVGAISSIQSFRRIKRNPLLFIDEEPRKNLLKEMLGPEPDYELPEAERAIRRFVGILTAWMAALFLAVWLEREGARIKSLATNGVLEAIWSLVVGAVMVLVVILFLYLWRLKEDEREGVQL